MLASDESRVLASAFGAGRSAVVRGLPIELIMDWAGRHGARLSKPSLPRANSGLPMGLLGRMSRVGTQQQQQQPQQAQQVEAAPVRPPGLASPPGAKKQQQKPKRKDSDGVHGGFGIGKLRFKPS